MADSAKPYFFCQVCNIICNNEGNKYSHLTGTRHLRNIESQRKGLPVTGGEKRKAANGTPYADVPPGPVVKQEIGPLDLKGVKVPLVGLQHVVEQQPRVDGRRQFACDLCPCKLGMESIIPHTTGLKHRMEYLKKYSEADFNLLSGLPRSEQTVAVVSMAQKAEWKNGRGKIKYLPPQQLERSRVEKEQHEYQALFPDREPRNNRPVFDEIPYQREEAIYNEPLYSDDYREGPSRKYVRRNDGYPEEAYGEDATFGAISRSNYREKMGDRGNYREEGGNYREEAILPSDGYDRPAVRRGDDYRHSDEYRHVDDRYELRERGRDRERERGREREREREHERQVYMEDPHQAPPSQFPIERMLQGDDGNFRLSGGNLGSLLTILSKCVVKNEEDAQMALQVSNALTQSLLKYRFQNMPGELLSATLNKSAENFLGSQGGGMGGLMQQNAFLASSANMMREQAMPRDQMPAPQLQLQQQQLRQQLQMLQEQQHELEMKQKMKEELRQERHQMPRQHPHPPSADEEEKYQRYASARGGSSYVYGQY